MTTADVNGDTKIDLIVANWGSTVSVLLNTGNGTFINQTTYSTGTNPWSVTTADNGDTKIDLIVANWGSNNNTGNGTFINQTTYQLNPWSVTTADVNRHHRTQTGVRTPLVFFSTQATEHSSIKPPIQLATTRTL